jgi:hypothetical protein
MERNELAALVKNLLGIDIVISNTPPSYREGGTRPLRQQRHPDE